MHSLTMVFSRALRTRPWELHFPELPLCGNTPDTQAEQARLTGLKSELTCSWLTQISNAYRALVKRGVNGLNRITTGNALQML